MARTFKQGLDYFPHDCGNFDDNLEYIIALHGVEGYYLYFRLLEKIYSQEGYYMKADSKTLVLFSSKINLPISRINDIIKDFLSEGLFNKKLFDKYNVLTSSGIQKRFIEAISRRKNVSFIKEYIIINNEITNAINVDINSINTDINSQSKIKKRKVKENKVKYAEFVLMTEQEYSQLIEKYGEEKTQKFIEILDNYKGSKGRKYKNDYRAILSWVVDKVGTTKEARRPETWNKKYYDGCNDEERGKYIEFLKRDGWKEKLSSGGGIYYIK